METVLDFNLRYTIACVNIKHKEYNEGKTNYV